MAEAPYKVVVLAAGRGSRLGRLTADYHKALLPVGSKAVVSHLIDKIDPTVEMVVAVGHQAEKLKDYLKFAHPGRKFSFVLIEKFTGRGAGPGYTLLQCRPWLNCPFVITTVDMLVEESIPPPTTNWIGVAPVSPSASVHFNTIQVSGGLVKEMRDKEPTNYGWAFIGTAGIRDHQSFWQALESDKSLIDGERQISNGLQSLVKERLAAVEFTWLDTGTAEGLKNARRKFSGAGGADHFDFSKQDEYLYFVGDRVIKYFADSQIALGRVERAKSLPGIVPAIIGYTSHFFVYRKLPGLTLYQSLDRSLFKQFLRWLDKAMWSKDVSKAVADPEFKEACWNFYHDKTYARVAKYFAIEQEEDTSLVINGQPVPALGRMLDQVPWALLRMGLPSIFHGDLQFDNILVTGRASQPFVLVDWRQDFAGLLAAGDRYYDLAKLYGGMIIPYHLIKKNLFSYWRHDNNIHFDFHQTFSLIEAQGVYKDFIVRRGYDWQHIQLLTALIFLNMAPLHEPPFRQMLRALGSLLLHRALTNTTAQPPGKNIEDRAAQSAI